MRNNYKNHRRVSGLLKSFLFVAALSFGGVGTIGTLWAMGVVELPFLKRGPQFPPGTVMVPVSGVDVPAFTKLTRDHIWDPKTGQFAVIPMPPNMVTPEMIVDQTKIFGRVLDHDKPKGYVFTEKDFLPKGTRAGMVAGIPTGKRSLTLEANKLTGVFGLKPGDHIDLVATLPIDSKDGKGIGGLNTTTVTQNQMAALQKRATVRVLAQDAVIVTPVTSRNKPTTSGSLTNGTTVRNVPIQEIVIAVSPAEVPAITQALATKVEVTCVARSGLPDEQNVESKISGADPISEMKVVESISGKKREAMVFSNDGVRVPAEQTGSRETASLSPSTPVTHPTAGAHQ